PPRVCGVAPGRPRPAPGRRRARARRGWASAGRSRSCWCRRAWPPGPWSGRHSRSRQARRARPGGSPAPGRPRAAWSGQNEAARSGHRPHALRSRYVSYPMISDEYRASLHFKVHEVPYPREGTARGMRGKGISYDTGFVSKGRNAREPFDPEVVERELQIIRDDLHCNAVRVMGGDPERLELAATYAADLGLEVWFSLYPLELTTDDLLSLFADCAERAERLRRRGAEVVFVTGAELSLMNKGFLPGDTFGERVELLNEPIRLRALIPEVAARGNELLATR